MDYRNCAGLIQVRMRVFIRGWPVSRPPSVADANFAGHRLLSQEMGKTFVDLVLFLADSQLAISKDGQPGAVVTSVFQSPQSLEKNRSRLFLANISNDAAHINYASRPEL